MPGRAKCYIGVVIAAGVIALAASLAGGIHPAHPIASLLYVALTIATSTLKVRLRGAPGTYSLNFLFIVIGLYYFTPAETSLAACAAVTVQGLWRARQKPTLVQLVFNIANVALSVTAAFAAGQSAFLAGVGAPRPAQMAVAVFVQFAVNTVIVSGILSLLQGKPLREVCAQWYEWSFPCYLTGAALAALIPIDGQAFHSEAMIILLPLAYLLHFFGGLSVSPANGNNDGGSAEPPRVLPVSARLYVGALLSIGALLLTRAVITFDPSNLNRFAGYLLVGLLISTWKIRLPGMEATVSAGFVVMLVAIAVLPFSQAIAASAALSAAQMLWKPEHRPSTLQVMSSVSSLLVSAALAHWAIRGGIGESSTASIPVMLAVSTALLFFLNTVLVSTAVCLANRKPLMRIWQRCYFWSLPYYLVGACFAGVMVMTCQTAGWIPSLLMIPLMGMVYVSYRLQIRKASAGSPAF